MTNLETVQQMYAAFGRGDVNAILENLAEDVRWEEWADNTAQKAGVPWLQFRRGREAAAGFFEVVGKFEITEFTVLSMMAGDDSVATELVFEARIPETGGFYRDEQMHLWTFDSSGKVIRFRHYADTAKHMIAAGVSLPV